MQADKERISRLRRLHWFKLSSFVAVLLCALIALFVIDNLLISFVVALVISYLASPIVSHFEARGVGQVPAILIVFAIFSVGFSIIFAFFIPTLVAQAGSLKESLPTYVDGTIKIIRDNIGVIESKLSNFAEVNLTEQIAGLLRSQSNLLVESIPKFISSSMSVLFLSPLLGFFILKDGRRLSRDLLKLVPNDYFELIMDLQYQISDQIGQFIRARLLESAIVGGVVLLGLWVIQFPYAILFALLAAATNLIPYIGPIVGAIPPFVLAIINKDPAYIHIALALIYLLAQLIDMFFIIPLVVARIVNLHPVTVILVVILGAEFLGVLGMLISIPVAAALKVTFTSIYKHITDYST